MRLMMLHTFIVPHSLESTFKLIISFSVNESIAEEAVLPLSDGEVNVGWERLSDLPKLHES